VQHSVNSLLLFENQKLFKLLYIKYLGLKKNPISFFFKKNLSNVLFLKTLCFIFAASNGNNTRFQVNSKSQYYD